MKIGILTYHRSHNYGALLQAYALKIFLSNNNFEDVEFIDYFPDYHKKMYENRRRKSLRNLCFKDILLYPYYYFFEFLPLYKLKERRRKIFIKFINNYIFPKSKSYQNQVYDTVIYGSDQIWRKQIGYSTPRFNDIYFGTNVIKANKRIAYSASMGIIKLNQSDELFLKNHLKNFNAVAVREKQLADIIRTLSNKPVFHTLDPVFLLSQEEWSLLCSRRQIKKDYILFYNLQLDEVSTNIAYKLSSQTNLPVIEVIGAISQKNYSSNTKAFSDPLEFISLIKHASFIVTSSFHGLAFAIIFQKQFYTFLPKNTQRVTSLLKMFKMEDRFIKSTKQIRLSDKIDYSLKLKIINKEITMSKKYLLNNIST